MEDQIEQEIQAKGLTAPRVTPADLNANIKGVYFFTADQGARHAFRDVVAGNEPKRDFAPLDPALNLLTFCVIVLNNGFTVTGESACASPENFDPEIGRKIAFENAKQKIWPLMGYALKQKLHDWAASLNSPGTGSCVSCNEGDPQPKIQSEAIGEATSIGCSEVVGMPESGASQEDPVAPDSPPLSREYSCIQACAPHPTYRES